MQSHQGPSDGAVVIFIVISFPVLSSVPVKFGISMALTTVTINDLPFRHPSSGQDVFKWLVPWPSVPTFWCWMNHPTT